MSAREFPVRVVIFRTVVIGLFLILLGNLFVMMVVRHGYYKDQALENRQDRFRVRAPRGRIFDRNGTLLADNLYVANIEVPGKTLIDGTPDSTLSRLISWFDLPREKTLAKLTRQKERHGSLVLVRNASMARITAVEERGRQLPGVRVRARTRRRYLFGALFAHLIGYVGEVGQADLDTTGDLSGYRLGDTLGKQGLESALEDHLRGRSGVKLEEVNATGRIVGREPVWLRDVEPGHDATLTISQPLQLAMASAIGKRRGCGVGISVKTGEVLAAFSYPSFDPNLMTVSISAEQWQRLVNDPAKPFFNRVVQATYPPASLYKTMTSLAALSSGVVGPDTYLEPCHGGLEFGDRYFRCWKHSGHGEMNHVEAIINSCDTYFYQLGTKLTLDQLAATSRSFGLGRPCTNLFSDEAAGNVPDKAWYDSHFGVGGWSRGVLLNNAIGQGELLVTPIQMAVLIGRLASSGKMPNPSFLLDPKPVLAPPTPLNIDEEYLSWLRNVLLETVERGTGKKARLPGIRVAGKTGTAQNPHGEDHAWFMCYAPADDPEVAVAVIVENAGHGSSVAAPAARSWLEAYFIGTGRIVADEAASSGAGI